MTATRSYSESVVDRVRRITTAIEEIESRPVELVAHEQDDIDFLYDQSRYGCRTAYRDHPVVPEQALR